MAKTRRAAVVLGIVAGLGVVGLLAATVLDDRDAPQDVVSGGTSAAPPSPLVPERAAGWRTTTVAPIAGRMGHVAAWTGQEVLVWGGRQPPPGGYSPDGPFEVAADDGAAYDPVPDTWRSIPPAPSDGGTDSHGTWTGDELVVWGGGEDGVEAAAFDPEGRSWRRLAPALAPLGAGAVVAWSGEEVLAFDGSTGKAYDPGADRWRELPPSPLRADGRVRATWTGEELLVAGIPDGEGATVELAAYRPADDRWELLPASPVLALNVTDAVWTGDELVVVSRSRTESTGAYRPATRSWRSLAPMPEGGLAFEVPPVWTGTEVLLGALAYDPAADRWRSVDAGRPPGPYREFTTATWTGNEAVVWGGSTCGSGASCVTLMTTDEAVALRPGSPGDGPPSAPSTPLAGASVPTTVGTAVPPASPDGPSVVTPSVVPDPPASGTTSPPGAVPPSPEPAPATEVEPCDPAPVPTGNAPSPTSAPPGSPPSTRPPTTLPDPPCTTYCPEPTLASTTTTTAPPGIACSFDPCDLPPPPQGSPPTTSHGPGDPCNTGPCPVPDPSASTTSAPPPRIEPRCT